jgi:hypothetical protein
MWPGGVNPGLKANSLGKRKPLPGVEVLDMKDDLTLDKWDQLSAKEREALAKKVAGDLPTGFRFHSLRQCQLGDQKHQVAEYEFQGTPFILIPGGSVTLGYDLNRPWEPTPEEQESWQATAEEYDLPTNPLEHIAKATLRPRKARLPARLMEATAQEVGWEPVAADDPEVREIVREHFGKKGSRSRKVNISRGDSSLRVERDEDGTIRAQRSLAPTHKELAARLAQAGFRFPTSDEWEYACGAGAPTLFRWGDHVLCDRYPTDISPAQAAWRRRWVLSGGKLQKPPGGFTSDWDLHRRPNAFGITIAVDPYKFELVAEPDITRGGDGGSSICGGAGFFIGWLTLATAYFEKHACWRKAKEPITTGYTIGRRVLPLA